MVNRIMKNRTLFLLCVVIASVYLQGQTSLSPAQIQQQLLAQPPQAITAQAQKAAAHGLNISVEVKQYVQADFGGNGAFNYIVALYGLSGQDGGYLRAFKVQGNSLALAGDEDDYGSVGGYGARLQLLDVNGDGIPEVEVTGAVASGRYELLPDLYMWTGSALHNMLSAVRAESGELVDIDGDGIMEVVGRPTCDVDSEGNPTNCGSGYDVYRLQGSDYKFFKTFSQDPTGFIGANGQPNYVRAFCKRLKPHDFSKDEIGDALRHHARGNDDRGDTVKLKFGGLDRLNVGPVDVNLVDTTSIVVAPHVLPLHVRVFSPGEKDGDDDRDDHDQNNTCQQMNSGRILVEVSRSDFLRSLQMLHPSGPLAAGDQVEVPLTAKLRDGTPVGATFTVKIVGSHYDSGKEH